MWRAWLTHGDRTFVQALDSATHRHCAQMGQIYCYLSPHLYALTSSTHANPNFFLESISAELRYTWRLDGVPGNSNCRLDKKFLEKLSSLFVTESKWQLYSQDQNLKAKASTLVLMFPWTLLVTMPLLSVVWVHIISNTLVLDCFEI